MTENEPFYVRQTAEPMTPDEARRWFQQAAEEAYQEGATFARYTEHPDVPGLLLIECWRVPPRDQGAPRFALVASEHQPSEVPQ